MTQNTKPLSNQSVPWKLVMAMMLLGAVVIALFYYESPSPISRRPGFNTTPDDPPGPEDGVTIEIPELMPTRFRNATAEVAYVGNRACIECHPDEHQTYLQTNHSRSLQRVALEREPPEGEFDHELSGRRYRIYRQDGELRLQEALVDAQGKEIVLDDHAAAYALGSGNYAKLYLSQVGDYLIESPMTWYPQKQQWGMSAGYELDPHQSGFGREVGWGCLYCHAGHVEHEENSNQHLHVSEVSISCERCHGPGALHVEERKRQVPIAGELDDSIVNLRHLSRRRKEDVCSQCHLSSTADVMVRTRKQSDFRPGMRMRDFRISYRLNRPESERTVSGQILQMRQSRCYIESESMTCATCHNPHAQESQTREEKIAHHRLRCLSCHQDNDCQQPQLERQTTQPPDDCIQCHMPKGPTDIPHFSFTHHRIGIHKDTSGKVRVEASDHLTPIDDLSDLPELEQQRLLGLANDAYANKLAGGLDDERRDDPYYRDLAKVFAKRAEQILTEVRRQGVRDAEVEAYFCRLHWRLNPQRCLEHGEAALRDPHISPATRTNVLFSVASTHFDMGHFQQAKPYLEELVGREFDELSLMLLAICQQKQGSLQEAMRLANLAIRANPSRADLHLFLSSIYRQQGELKKGAEHQQRAILLQQRIPQPAEGAEAKERRRDKAKRDGSQSGGARTPSARGKQRSELRIGSTPLC